MTSRLLAALCFGLLALLAIPTSTVAAPGWVKCGDPGEGQVVFLADVRARDVTCPRARTFALSYERKTMNRKEFFPRSHRGYSCTEKRWGDESYRFNCRRGSKRISFIMGL
jgi:hypothetical protein